MTLDNNMFGGNTGPRRNTVLSPAQKSLNDGQFRNSGGDSAFKRSGSFKH